MSTPPHSQKLYYREKMRAKWESEKIRQDQASAKQVLQKPYSIAEALCGFLENSFDKECCLLLDPYIDLHYKKDKEVAIYLKVRDDMIAVRDIIRFIHATIVAKFFPSLNVKHKPLSVIVFREIDNVRAYQRTFEMIHSPHEWSELRQGFSILRTEGLSKAGVVDILAQPITPNAKGLNADNFNYQLSILSHGKPYALSVAEDMIEGQIFIHSLRYAQGSHLQMDSMDLGNFFVGLGVLALLVFW